MNPAKNPTTELYFRITARQDFIFYGQDFAQFFVSENPEIQIAWHMQEESCVLKDQTLMTICSTQKQAELYPLLKGVSYLCGTATLVRSYVHKTNQAQVVASCSELKDFEKWEKQAISAMGGTVGQEFDLCETQQDILQSKKDVIAIDFKNENLRELLNEIPPHKKRGLWGHFLPTDLYQLADFRLDFLFPKLLQGNFPQIKLKIHEPK